MLTLVEAKGLRLFFERYLGRAVHDDEPVLDTIQEALEKLNRERSKLKERSGEKSDV